ncbi:MAG TPA: acyl-CoA dehydrogenase family protein, partial [Mycobacterium sp.]|nr:acyl-CoA dehydrogenase family protein [Mycobacterium sp.]
GKALVPTPLLGTTLAELALLSAPEPDGDTLAGLAAGEAIGAVVFGGGAAAAADNYVLNGDLVGAGDVVVGTDGTELTRWTTFTATAVDTLDPTRRLGRVTAGDTAPVGPDPGLADLAALLLAAEQIGAAARCLELTVDYTKSRVQFGRPIVSFQALKHRMADLHVAVQSARAVVADAIADPSPTSAALARVTASEAFSAVAADAVQLHGGIAITWESDIQLYFKRAHGSSQLLGLPVEHLRRLEAEVFSIPVR